MVLVYLCWALVCVYEVEKDENNNKLKNMKNGKENIDKMSG